MTRIVPTSSVLRALAPKPPGENLANNQRSLPADMIGQTEGSKATEHRALRPEVRTSPLHSFRALADEVGSDARVRKHSEPSSRIQERERLKEASREFEAVFLRYLASAMSETVPSEGEMKGSHIYQGMIDEQLGRLLADSGRGLRLAETLSRQVSELPQEDDHGSP